MDTNSRYDAVERFEHAPQFRATDPENRVTRITKAAAPVTTIEFGSGWYHAEAIKDAREMHGHADRW